MTAPNVETLLPRWLELLSAQNARVMTLLTQAERERICRLVLTDLQVLLEGDVNDPAVPSYQALTRSLADISANFAERGFSPSETATFVFSIKEVYFEVYRAQFQGEDLAAKTWRLSLLVDRLGLHTFEAFSIARERLVKSQAKAIADLSTPVIQVWDGIIALPLVGSIDSMRAKEVMEKLLESVVRNEADIVIIDITGVPVVDTQVANRLMRTVEAVRLLGTKSIITGINPVIAQTLVQLGVDLGQLTTKASLRSGLQQAFRELKLRVVTADA
ncbi:MAG: anti-sigma-factor antagonist [Cyanobacteria bacterium RYN_339]|nr:anti-sigma-factor antagonist [Cyanobacteria bacterium RYN_339]